MLQSQFVIISFDNPAIQAATNTIKAFFQPKDGNNTISTTATVVTALVGLFAYEQYVYLRKKKNLPGPSYKIPIIGALMDSVNPTFEGYMSKWKSGDLSCVSVFDRYVEASEKFIHISLITFLMTDRFFFFSLF